MMVKLRLFGKLWEKMKELIKLGWYNRFFVRIRYFIRLVFQQFIEKWTASSEVYKWRVFCRWYTGVFCIYFCFFYFEPKVPGLCESVVSLYWSLALNVWVDQYSNLKARWRILFFLLTTNACIFVILKFYFLMF